MKVADLVLRFQGELLAASRLGPVLDVACGPGMNGLYLAGLGVCMLMVDRSEEALAEAVRNRREMERAFGRRLCVQMVRMDLETSEPPEFAPQSLGAVLVFRYLHRPLIPVLLSALAPGGLLVSETFMEGQEVYGKPRNPDHLLKAGELARWFAGYEVLHHFEGHQESPPRFMGAMACRKPGPACATACAVASGRPA